jgi:hypothetical protein
VNLGVIDGGFLLVVMLFLGAIGHGLQRAAAQAGVPAARRRSAMARYFWGAVVALAAGIYLRLAYPEGLVEIARTGESLALESVAVANWLPLIVATVVMIVAAVTAIRAARGLQQEVGQEEEGE